MTREAADTMGSVALMFRHSIGYMTGTAGSRGETGLIMHVGMVTKLYMAICTVDLAPCCALTDSGLYSRISAIVTGVALEILFGMFINNVGLQAKVQSDGRRNSLLKVDKYSCAPDGLSVHDSRCS